MTQYHNSLMRKLWRSIAREPGDYVVIAILVFGVMLGALATASAFLWLDIITYP